MSMSEQISKSQPVKKTLKITTLSNIHIGCGDFYTHLDYYIEGGKAKILDMERMLESLDDIKRIDEMTNIIKFNMRNNRIEDSIKEIYKGVNIHPEDFILKEVDCKIEEDKRVQVEKFINQNGRYYVPGSSIKGAIRTAYIFDYYDKNIGKLVDILEGDNKNKNAQYNEKGEAVVKKAMGKIKDDSFKCNEKGKAVVEGAIGGIENDFFKYLLITDSNYIDPNNFEFIETRRYNLEYKKRGKSKLFGNKECKETLKKGSQFTLELTIKKGFPKDFNGIKNICNNFTRAIIEFEMNNKYLTQYLKNFYKNEILNKLDNNGNGFYLPIGSGSGFLSKTIYLLLHKHNKDLNLIRECLPMRKSQKVNDYLDFPRTRVIDIKWEMPLSRIKIKGIKKREMPLGWIKIEEEIK
ncbi:type III-A CRISPR-associated RAMP protein Csm5 [Methanothermococcus sp. SCGC AD-155-C09]|nr:type III-A CRISPR-associated RAMP protein Csm5 [Methanothermococcus sp. SCGC AD-155-C09]